jgi:hypothetical protein
MHVAKEIDMQVSGPVWLGVEDFRGFKALLDA